MSAVQLHTYTYALCAGYNCITTLYTYCAFGCLVYYGTMGGKMKLRSFCG